MKSLFLFPPGDDAGLGSKTQVDATAFALYRTNLANHFSSTHFGRGKATTLCAFLHRMTNAHEFRGRKLPGQHDAKLNEKTRDFELTL